MTIYTLKHPNYDELVPKWLLTASTSAGMNVGGIGTHPADELLHNHLDGLRFTHAEKRLLLDGKSVTKA